MPEHIYDKGYKRVLSKKEYFLHFVKKYIRVNWIQNIQPEDLNLINANFVDEAFQEREADIVYKAKNGDQDVYFYVLLELQSTADYTMPFRLLVYMVELLKREFTNTPKETREKKEFRLPAVVPIVLYNGNSPWSVVKTFREYTMQADQFADNIIDFQYLMLDLMRQDDDYILNTNNALDDIFLMDRGTKENNLIQSIQKIAQRAPQHTHEDILEVWDWFKDLVFDKVDDPNLLEMTQEAFMKGDVKAMTTNVERLFERRYEKGIAEGMEKGMEKGVEKSKLEIARRLIKMRLSIPMITEATGLSEKDIEKIKQEAN